jgi:PPP family 3-phenylpropionic acid transporter
VLSRRRTPLLRLYYFVFFSALGAYNPFFPSWLRARGIEGLRMSTITALNPLLGIVGPVAFGIVADRFALRGSLLRVAAVGALAPVAAIAVMALGGTAPSYVLLLALNAFFAFFRGPMVSLADVTALEEPGSYGRTRLFGSAGFTLAVVLVGAALDPTSLAALPVVLAVSLALTLVVATQLPAKSARVPEPLSPDARRIFRSPDFLALLLVGFLWFGSHVSYELCFSMHLADLGASSAFIGCAWAVGVVAEIVLMGNAARLFARFTPSRLLAFGLAAGAVRFAALASVSSLPLLFLLQPLHAVSFALVWITALEFVRQRAPARLLATTQSLFSTSAALGSTLGMLVWGPLYARSGGATVFASAAVVAAIGSVATALLGALASPVGSEGAG